MALNMNPSYFEEGLTTTKPPRFNGANYATWKNRMMIYIKSQNIEYWKVIVKGPRVPKDDNGVVKKELDYDDEDWRYDQINANAMQLIFCALTIEETNRVSFCKSAKEMWERLEVTHEGTTQVKETKINMLLHDYELFKMKEGEPITSMLDRFSAIMNGLASLGRHMDDS